MSSKCPPKKKKLYIKLNCKILVQRLKQNLIYEFKN